MSEEVAVAVWKQLEASVCVKQDRRVTDGKLRLWLVTEEYDGRGRVVVMAQAANVRSADINKSRPQLSGMQCAIMYTTRTAKALHRLPMHSSRANQASQRARRKHRHTALSCIW